MERAKKREAHSEVMTPAAVQTDATSALMGDLKQALSYFKGRQGDLLTILWDEGYMAGRMAELTGTKSSHLTLVYDALQRRGINTRMGRDRIKAIPEAQPVPKKLATIPPEAVALAEALRTFLDAHPHWESMEDTLNAEAEPDASPAPQPARRGRPKRGTTASKSA